MESQFVFGISEGLKANNSSSERSPRCPYRFDWQFAVVLTCRLCCSERPEPGAGGGATVDGGRGGAAATAGAGDEQGGGGRGRQEAPHRHRQARDRARGEQKRAGGTVIALLLSQNHCFILCYLVVYIDVRSK